MKNEKWLIDNEMRGIDNRRVAGVKRADGSSVANCGAGGEDVARLIASAPDLLAALESMLRCHDCGNSTTCLELWDAANAARDAIAKAKGGAS